jgi:hypothetical protein
MPAPGNLPVCTSPPHVPIQGCPAFVHLTLTGGAIGSGPPLALGAAVALAVAAEQHSSSSSSSNSNRQASRGISSTAAAAAAAAAPDVAAATRRRVINLQADGSAMYSLQVRHMNWDKRTGFGARLVSFSTARRHVHRDDGPQWPPVNPIFLPSPVALPTTCRRCGARRGSSSP